MKRLFYGMKRKKLGTYFFNDFEIAERLVKEFEQFPSFGNLHLVFRFSEIF